MKKKQIKESIRKETKKIKELPNEFMNILGAYCVNNDIHMKTVYQLCKVKHIDQMLDTMYETTIRTYELHEPTLKRIKDTEVRTILEQKLKQIRLILPRI